MPQIRIVDTVSAGSLDGGLEAADARLVEFTITELERLLEALGAEGLAAFCAYAKVLRREPGSDDRPVVVVDDFSGRWLHEHTSLGRNAAYRAQNALEAAGLFDRLVSRAGQGARGKQKARLNPELVLVPGGADGSVEGLRRHRAGPVSRKVGNRETGLQIPVPQGPGDRETGADSRYTGTRETGPLETGFAQVDPGFPQSGDRGSRSTSSDSPSVVIHELLSSDSGPGLLRRVLAPTIRSHPERAAERLLQVFNKSWLAERTEGLIVPLRMDAPRTQRAEQFVRYLFELVSGELDPRSELVKLKVQGRPRMPDNELAERLVVGLVVGLGMRPAVSSWGAWLNTVTKPGWSPKPNAVLDAFVDQVKRLDGPAPAAPRAVDDPGDPGDPDGAGQTRGAAPAGQGSPGQPALSEDVVQEHLDQARERYPHLFRSGGDSPTRRQLAVRLYLEDLAARPGGSGRESAAS